MYNYYVSHSRFFKQIVIENAKDVKKSFLMIVLSYEILEKNICEMTGLYLQMNLNRYVWLFFIV